MITISEAISLSLCQIVFIKTRNQCKFPSRFIERLDTKLTEINSNVVFDALRIFTFSVFVGLWAVKLRNTGTYAPRAARLIQHLDRQMNQTAGLKNDKSMQATSSVPDDGCRPVLLFCYSCCFHFPSRPGARAINI